MTLPVYLAIGLLYTLINCTIRKLEGRSDPWLVLAWWFIWPIFLPISLYSILTNKNENEEK